MAWLVQNYASSWNSCFEALQLKVRSVDEKLSELDAATVVFPPKENIFKALQLVTPESAKVVLIGQDPYHGEGEAMGLSFSVPQGVKVPPSLKNIYKERESDLGIPVSNSGDLSSWAQQGVLLLNATLTVEKDSANSHQKIGWQEITDGVIRYLSEQERPLVFLLWGKFAEKKRELIDESKHDVLVSAHPSPFSARRGFFGSKPFSKINKILEKRGETPIDWRNE